MNTVAPRNLDAPHPEPITRAPAPWTRRTVLRQRWTELGFFHWPMPPDAVQQLLPGGLRVDVFDGQAWVGLIPFEMRDVRFGNGPVVPVLGSFIEINVRTYVVDAAGRRGVWFFSLDVPRSPIVGVARSFFALPYCWASASHEVDQDRHRYRMRRRWPHRDRAVADIAFEVGDAIERPDVLDDFLTARWALMTRRGSRLAYGAVHHPAWPLHEAGDVRIDGDVVEAAGLPRPVGAPHARYSPGTEVSIGRLDWMPRREAR